MDLAARIEAYLFTAPRWVPKAELCERFSIDERCLRRDRRTAPIWAAFAISSDRKGENGYKHLAHATVRERLDFKHRIRRNLVARARALRDYEQALSPRTPGEGREMDRADRKPTTRTPPTLP